LHSVDSNTTLKQLWKSLLEISLCISQLNAHIHGMIHQFIIYHPSHPSASLLKPNTSSLSEPKAIRGPLQQWRTVSSLPLAAQIKSNPPPLQ